MLPMMLPTQKLAGPSYWPWPMASNVLAFLTKFHELGQMVKKLLEIKLD
jgi:hypothetical protein